MQNNCGDDVLAGRHNAPLIGVAPLVRRAFAGEDLAPLGQILLERAQIYPNDAHAYMDFSTVLQLTGNREDALAVQAEAVMLQSHYTLPARQAGGLTVLVLMGKGDLMANTQVEFLVENSDVTLELLYLCADEDFPGEVPEHDVMLVAVAESDANQPLLEQLVDYASDWPRPVINRPGRIRLLSRDGAYAALRGISGMAMPATVRTARGALYSVVNGTLPIETLLGDGGFPIIVRPLGSHAGRQLEKIDTPAQLGKYLDDVTGGQFYVSRFVDYRGADGMFRKYRLVLVEGKPYMCQHAVSPHWMIHHLDGGVTGSAEEAARMADFDAGFALRHAAALSVINQRLGLPYLGIDCAEMPNGDLLIFEVDNAMIVHAMDPEAIYPHRAKAMRKVFTAFRDLLGKAQCTSISCSVAGALA